MNETALETASAALVTTTVATVPGATGQVPVDGGMSKTIVDVPEASVCHCVMSSCAASLGAPHEMPLSTKVT